jgi:hypothetical protein
MASVAGSSPPGTAPREQKNRRTRLRCVESEDGHAQVVVHAPTGELRSSGSRPSRGPASPPVALRRRAEHAASARWVRVSRIDGEVVSSISIGARQLQHRRREIEVVGVGVGEHFQEQLGDHSILAVQLDFVDDPEPRLVDFTVASQRAAEDMRRGALRERGPAAAYGLARANLACSRCVPPARPMISSEPTSQARCRCRTLRPAGRRRSRAGGNAWG